MRFYRYPEKNIRILENGYKDTFATVNICGELNELSDQFKTIEEVLQGCILSPLLLKFLEQEQK